MPAFPGTCQLHRAEVLSVRGELDEAAAEVVKASALLARVAPWAEGDAHRVLGDIRLTCGDLEGAEAAFRQAHAPGWDPQPGLARLQIAKGQAYLAQRGLERALADGDWALRERRGQILCTLVHAALAAGDVERARAAIHSLNTDPHLLSAQALKAMASRAQAELAWQEQRRADALQDLRQAARHWHAVGSRPGEAETRLRLAQCLLDDDDPVAAEIELHAVEVSPVLASVAALRRRMETLRAAVRR
jgi:tetratricopeptide (TPR) repeat protein